MRLLRHHDITDARLIAHSVAEDDHPTWSAVTAYTLGQRVIRTQTHRIYECLIAGADATVPELAPARWLDVGPTNRWAAFDQAVGTSTTATGSISMTLAPGQRFDTLALLDVQASHVTVTVTLGAEELYRHEAQMSGTVEPVVDYYTYWQAEFSARTVLVLTDLPSTYSQAQVTVEISSSAGGQVSLGTIKVGRLFELGKTEYGASAGITDYSTIETDAFGVTAVVKRSYAKTMTLRALIDNDRLDAVIAVLTAYRAQPAVWVGTDRAFESLVVYGFAKDWSGQIDYPQASYLPITIRGLT